MEINFNIFNILFLILRLRILRYFIEYFLIEVDFLVVFEFL